VVADVIGDRESNSDGEYVRHRGGHSRNADGGTRGSTAAIIRYYIEERASRIK